MYQDQPECDVNFQHAILQAWQTFLDSVNNCHSKEQVFFHRNQVHQTHVKIYIYLCFFKTESFSLYEQ